MKERNVERLLADQPTLPPPKGLAERIKDEIPDQLELSPELLRASRVVPMRRSRRWYMAAAAAVTITLAGAVTWQMRETGLSMEVFETTADAPARQDVPQSESVRDESGKIASVDGAASGARVADEAKTIQKNKPDLQSDANEYAGEDFEVGDELQLLEDVDPSIAGDAETEVGNRAAELTPAAKDHLARSNDQDKMDELSSPSLQRVTRDAREADAPAPMDDRSIGSSAAKEHPSEPASGRVEEVVGGLATTDTGVSSEEIAISPESRSTLGEYAVVTPVAKKRVLAKGEVAQTIQASTGGTEEPNDQPYGDVFFREYGVNPFIDTEDDNLSTFGLDVDTGSYTVARRYLRDGHLPPREAVRVEEFVNSFDYGDQPPRRGDFALTAEGAPSPFAEGERYYLLRFAVAAREVAAKSRPPAVLTFVVDTSGSMNRENRLGLVKQALYELLGHLRSDDQVGLVVYGSRGEVLLEPTTDHEAIRSAIGRLHGAGSTNAEDGLLLAYSLAEEYRDREGINRIILCSDGVANVGRTGPESILGRIERFADAGIELTTVGFGMGNYSDVLMEQLADAGDGRYAYVDALPEARRIFVEELTGTLMTIGSEAKAQVEFNPDVVSRYRLLGYENRDIADDRFRDPTVDAGEIGAGHTVTALYEIKLHKDRASNGGTIAILRLRYRPMGSNTPVELEKSIRVRQLEQSWHSASPSLKLATLVAEFAEILKRSYWAKDGDLQDILRRAQQLSPDFAGNARVADFVSLVAAASEIEGNYKLKIEN